MAPPAAERETVAADWLADFIAWCRANPKQATYGSPGAGWPLHFTGVQLKLAEHLPKMRSQLHVKRLRPTLRNEHEVVKL
jgi:hypothetical protein